MSVTTISDKTSETRFYQRYLEFEGASPILLARNYSRGGKEFLPEFAYAKWNHGSEITNVEVSGYVLKKDRSIGQQLTRIDYITPHNRDWGKSHSWATPAPSWLLELFGFEFES